MKAQVFLELVDKTLKAQQNYFAARRKGVGVITERNLLIESKDLEKQCRAVIAEGKLEPDEPTATVQVFTTEEFQEQLRLINEAQLRLDFPGIERPTDGQGEQKT